MDYIVAKNIYFELAQVFVLSRARAGPGKCAVTILSRKNILNTARRHNRHILKYLC
jgi:hypothetical protein